MDGDGSGRRSVSGRHADLGRVDTRRRADAGGRSGRHTGSIEWLGPRPGDLVGNLTAYRVRKGALLAGLRGTVLEIGAGRGANFELLPPDVRWIGLEPSPAFARVLRRRAGGRGPVLEAPAEHIPLPDRSVDAVLATTVLCSVDDPEQVLREVRRVLQPGGQFLFFEHVAARPGTFTAGLQHAIAPITYRLDHGCRPDRPTADLVASGGFGAVELTWFRQPGPLGAFGPYVAGRAEV